MIEINQLSKHFGSFTAVDDISFEVKRGEVLGFLGPNGAGKSTTMKMITGFLTPTTGFVKIDGDDIASSPIQVKSKIGYLPEGAPAYGDMTPYDFLSFIGDIRGLSRDTKQQRMREVIRQVNLADVLHQPIDTLSKGFKRRVGLAQAILHDPDVLIMDEPTDGLDPNQKHEVRELIKHMSQEKVIVLSTHILEEVEAVCSRAIIIAKGAIVADDTPEALGARSEFHQNVELQVQNCETESLLNALKNLNDVEDVFHHTENDVECFRVKPTSGLSIIASVSHLVRDKQLDVIALHAEKGRLTDVFRQLTVH